VLSPGISGEHFGPAWMARAADFDTNLVTRHPRRCRFELSGPECPQIGDKIGIRSQKWDESNSPMRFDYMQNAARNRKWSNMSNFVRLYSLFAEGGIYLDTMWKY